MRHVFATFALLFAVAAFSQGCHTVQGAGKDITKVGEKGQEVIDPEGQK